MLTELRIENFAIIDNLELRFNPGFIVFTGETGAGKSIIIDAVETVLGGRAEATMIRSGVERANIDATFQISPAIQPYIKPILEREGLLDDTGSSNPPEQLTLGREIRRSGRNIARINGRSINNSLLNEVGAYLVDVHGQSEHLSLLHVQQHLQLLDRFANITSLLEIYRKTYHDLMQVRRELTDLRQAESDAARRADLLRYQISEIEAARLRSDEEEGLREEHNRLANAEGLAALTLEALQLLDEGSPESPSIVDLLGQLTHSLNGLTKLDPTQAATSGQAEIIFENLEELSRNLHLYQENIEFNPKRLGQVEERLNLIHSLKRKYGNSITAVLEFGQTARNQLDTITHAGERIQELEITETDLLKRLSEHGQNLSKKRHEAAVKLSGAVETELSDLKMSGSSFQVEFKVRPDPQGVIMTDGQKVAFGPTGLEHVEFLVAPNPGEGLKPLVKIASGGETSRLMLALKNVLARADQVPTLIFDEIDQGIGGRVGTIVGQKLRTLSRQHQVLCITHLPQLAAYGKQHIRVMKLVESGRTHTQVEVIEGEIRLVELAQMMGELTEGTRRSARELLQSAQKNNPT